MPIITIKPPEPQKVKPESERYSKWKVSIVCALSAIPAGLFAYLFVKGNILLSIIPGLVFVSMATLRPFLIRKFKVAIICISLDALVMGGIVFALNPDIDKIILVIITGTTLAFFAIGYLRGISLIDNFLKIKFMDGCGAAFPGVFTGITIFVAVFIGFTFTPADLLSHKMFDPIIKSVADPAIAYFAPGTNSNATLSDFASVRAKQMIADSESVQNFITMPEAVKDDLIKKNQDAIIETLNAELGGETKLDANKTVHENLYLVVTDNIKKNIDKLPAFWFSFTIALSILLLLRALGFIVVWITSFGAFIIAQLLISFKFIQITLEEKSREFYSMK